MIRRAFFALVAALAAAVPASAQFSTRAQQEFGGALTDAGYFGFPRTPTASLAACNTLNKGAARYDTTTNTMKFCNGTAWGAFAGGVGLGDSNAWTGPNSFIDGNFSLIGSADATKIFKVEVDGQTTGNTVTLSTGGTAANPTLQMGTSIWYLRAAGVDSAVIGAGLIGIGTGCLYGGSAIGNTDVCLTRDGAATWQMGQDANGAAVNQTFKAHDGITGTDILGAKLTLASGLGTGAAVSNPLTINRQITKATGTTAQTYAPAVIHCPSKILSNTSATTTTVATITTTTTTGGNVTVDYGTLACSASTCDADGGIVKVAWNNNAGTVAAAMTAVALQADSDATGNITTGPTATVATNVVSIKATPVFTTIVPTTVWFTASYTVHSIGDTVVCQ